MPDTPEPTKSKLKITLPRDATVLVVEDNVSNFVLIARMLGYLGMTGKLQVMRWLSMPIPCPAWTSS
jgi:CheY-like chemotaxis protein